MKKVLFAGIILTTVFMTGCGRTKTLTCSKIDSVGTGDLQQKIVANFNGSKVKDISLEMDLVIKDSYKNYKGTLIKSVDNSMSVYKELKGVKYNLKETDKGAKIVINFNFSKMDANAKSKTNVIGTSQNYDYNKKELETMGYKCK